MFSHYIRNPWNLQATGAILIQKKCKEAINNCVKYKLDDHSSSLKVQRKFEDIINLDNKSRTWKKRTQSGLPKGQPSFLLKAGSDTLQHPVNFWRWKMQRESKCHLCSFTILTILHILNVCPKTLEQGCFTRHHDSA